MRKVVLYHLVSLDGVAEEPSNWVFAFDDAAQENLAGIIAKQDAVLLGRKTYEYWVGYWPTSDMAPFASFINGTTKHVYSSTLRRLEWANSSLVSTSALDHVRELKAQDGGDIGVHGSIDLSQALMRAGVVDEVQLVIAPTIAGTGRRLFQDRAIGQRMSLVDLARTPSGLVLATYETGTPS